MSRALFVTGTGTDIGKRTEKYIGKYQEAQKRGQKYPGEVLGKHE